jgi:hypothetical protein
MLGTMSATVEKLQRIVYREFLLEPGLHLEVGLEALPSGLASALACSAEDSVARLLARPLLDDLTLEALRPLFRIRDMSLVSRTAAALSAALKAGSVSYDQCCRAALSYAVIGSSSHVFSALRAAASKNDSFARHHYLYGLMLALDDQVERARWELGMALQAEPYEQGRSRIRWVLDILDGTM